MPALHWFRRDLRLHDNPALTAAADASRSDGGEVVGLFVLDDETPNYQGYDYRVGGAQRWWLHHSLEALSKDMGGRLLLRHGRADKVVREVAKDIGASSVHAGRLEEPWERESEEALADLVTFHEQDTLVPPGEVRTGGGAYFKVYGPFWRALTHRLPPDEPLPKARVKWATPPKGDTLASWKLLPTKPDWSTGFDEDWTPGEEGAARHLEAFEAEVARYDARRNLPSEEGTSRLSPHLHWGEVSPRQLWYALHRLKGGSFLKELAWRDFARAAMLVQPDIGWTNGREKMNGLRHRTGKAADADFRAWAKGRTGYPIVDAGMRQLWTTGWMHNRVRMIVASFLAKHLLLDWRRGERWFWDTLVDADYGNNSLNWQWVAGTGSDSQIASRIMTPIGQSEKFGAGDYIRRWVPELADLDDRLIHDPPDEARGDYPTKIVEHREGRERYLAALAKARG
ncbi:deoxyribodipyrimidine photo-lyase [Sphingomonas sp. ASV193]|uniref:cryptochrome/photolyase family protein n=1 Tax=Sphingomonas sp. ASV193 TaxID=3144405 RepID=UPI0032E852BA